MADEKSKQTKWLSIGDASKYLGISRDTLRRWEKAGKIKPIRSPTNRRYYTKNILDQVMDQKNKPQETKTKPKTTKKTSSRLKIILLGIISFLIACGIGVAALLFFFN